MRIRNIFLLLFVTTAAIGQQINPVPDYIFRYQMSVGRNAATDTAAYFSIGPRFGANKGFQPPMVVDTASFSGSKRNGLTIFSVQKNKYVYWDSVGVKWAEMAGTAGNALTSADTVNLLSTKAFRKKGDDSLGAIITTRTDTGFIATRARVQKAVDSLGSVKQNTLTNPVTGTGTTNYIPKFTGTSTIGNSVAFDNGGTELLVNTTTDVGNYALQVSGASISTGAGVFGTTSGSLSIGTTIADIYSRFDDRYLTLTDNGNVALAINAGGSAGRGAQIYMGAGGVRYFTFAANANDSYFGTATSIPTRFEINNTEAMRLNTGRELLIGTTSDAGAYILQTSGAIYNTAGGDLAATSGEVMIGKTTAADSGFFKLQVQGNVFLPQVNRLQFGQPVDTTRTISAIGNQFQVSVNLEEFNNGNSGPDLFLRRGRGTVLQKADIDSGTRIGAVDYQGYSNGTWYSSLALSAETSKADTVGNVIAADFVILQPHATATLVENMRLFSNGGHLRLTGGLETEAPSGGSRKRWKIGEAATVSPTSPNRTLRVEVDGTVYYIHAKTTND